MAELCAQLSTRAKSASVESDISAFCGSVESYANNAIGFVTANLLVSMITYGTLIIVHDLGFVECAKSYVFHGSKNVSREQIFDQLDLTTPSCKWRGAQHSMDVLCRWFWRVFVLHLRPISMIAVHGIIKIKLTMSFIMINNLAEVI